MNLFGASISDGIENLRMLKRYSPYKYSGRWFVIQIDDQVKAFRTLKACQNNAAKAQLEKIEVWEVA